MRGNRFVPDVFDVLLVQLADVALVGVRHLAEGTKRSRNRLARELGELHRLAAEIQAQRAGGSR